MLASRGDLWLAVLLLTACSEGAGAEVRSRLDSRLEELREDDAALRAALDPPPAVMELCDVPANAVGPLIVGEGPDHPSERIDTFQERTEELRERADSISAAGAERWLSRYSGDEWARHELAVIATTYDEPTLEYLAEYQPGRVSGRAVLWDHVEERVLCARDVDVVPPPLGPDGLRVTSGTGRDAIASRTGALHWLERYLREAVVTQGLAAMRADPPR